MQTERKLLEGIFSERVNRFAAIVGIDRQGVSPCD